MLLAGEPERRDDRERPPASRSDAALLDCEPDEPDRGEDREHLRGMPEVRVDRPRLGACQPICGCVRTEGADRGQRCDESPGQDPPPHSLDDASGVRAMSHRPNAVLGSLAVDE
jgi:hypothetical protein